MGAKGWREEHGSGGAYASGKAEDPKSVCSRAGFDWGGR
jgi:hypothetical protein